MSQRDFAAVKNHIRKVGWHKGSMFALDKNSACCVLGGMEQVGCREYPIINALAAGMFPDRLDKRPSLQHAARVNDHPETTWEDMEALLDKAQLFIEGEIV